MSVRWCCRSVQEGPPPKSDRRALQPLVVSSYVVAHAAMASVVLGVKAWFNNPGVHILLFSAVLVLFAIHTQSRVGQGSISLAHVDCPTCRSVSQLQRTEGHLTSKLGEGSWRRNERLCARLTPSGCAQRSLRLSWTA